MKCSLFTCFFAMFGFLTFAQTLTQNINNRLLKKEDAAGKILSLPLDDFNFCPLFMHTDNSVIYGFIGDKYQRIRIKFIIVSKNHSSPNIYHVYGKSMVKDNICEFKGTITISSIKKYKIISYGADDKYKNKGLKGEYVILGSYTFNENAAQVHPGTFKGEFQSNFYLDKSGQVHYDDIDDISDGYTNNQFIGQWISYKGNIIKRCNWGDFRIPHSGDLDIGAGEFSPNERYLKYGWQTRSNLVVSQDDKAAKQTEEAKWWQ